MLELSFEIGGWGWGGGGWGVGASQVESSNRADDSSRERRPESCPRTYTTDGSPLNGGGGGWALPL